VAASHTRRLRGSRDGDGDEAVAAGDCALVVLKLPSQEVAELARTWSDGGEGGVTGGVRCVGINGDYACTLSAGAERTGRAWCAAAGCHLRVLADRVHSVAQLVIAGGWGMQIHWCWRTSRPTCAAGRRGASCSCRHGGCRCACRSTTRRGWVRRPRSALAGWRRPATTRPRPSELLIAASSAGLSGPAWTVADCALRGFLHSPFLALHPPRHSVSEVPHNGVERFWLLMKAPLIRTGIWPRHRCRVCRSIEPLALLPPYPPHTHTHIIL
jgi:hypothetical protein